tara:strand:- start:2526 stop:2693 length:168 start_codon:yes stop_codon:yes gene_type:complete
MVLYTLEIRVTAGREKGSTLVILIYLKQHGENNFWYKIVRVKNQVTLTAWGNHCP